MHHILQTPYGKAKLYQKGFGQKILIVPGYSESIIHCQAVVDALSRFGYEVTTFTQPRRGSHIAPLDRQRDIILSVLAYLLKKDEKVIAVAHSLGSASLLRAARLKPKLFTALILMQPSGMGQPQTLLQVAGRVGIKTIKNHSHSRAQKVITPNSGFIGHRQIVKAHLASSSLVARNPLLALREAKVAIRHMIIEDSKAVSDKGVRVHIIQSQGDELFHKRSSIDYEQIIGLSGSLSSLADEKSYHDTFWLQPEQTAAMIAALTKHLEKR